MPKIPTHTITIEDYPKDYSGPEFLTLIEYGSTQFVTIVDIIAGGNVSAYVLDMCKSEHIDDVAIVSLIANNWGAYKGKPVSILFGALGISQQMSRIHRTFALSDINRVIGRFPQHNLNASKTVKRRRRRDVDPIIEIHPGRTITVDV